MTVGEYKARLRELRPLINALSFDMGNTYSTELDITCKLLNECLNGNLSPSDNDDKEYSLDINLLTRNPIPIFTVNSNFRR